jgi:LemA protein
VIEPRLRAVQQPEADTFRRHTDRNEMVRKRETVNAAWSQVDVVLQRRSDLIPNLVETVKGFAAHEEEVFGDIAAARAAMMGAKTPQEKIAANGQLDSALSRLLVVVENYGNSGPTKTFFDCRTSWRARKTG